MFLTLTLVLLVSSVCFAGSWRNTPIEGYLSMPGRYVQSEEVTSTGNPGVTLYVYGSPNSTVKIELQKEAYIPSEGKWGFKTIDETTVTVRSGMAYGSLFTDTYFREEKCRVKVTSQSYGVRVDGNLQYFEQ